MFDSSYGKISVNNIINCKKIRFVFILLYDVRYRLNSICICICKCFDNFIGNIRICVEIRNMIDVNLKFI